jgi:hypothetical protein
LHHLTWNILKPTTAHSSTKVIPTQVVVTIVTDQSPTFIQYPIVPDGR